MITLILEVGEVPSPADIRINPAAPTSERYRLMVNVWKLEPEPWHPTRYIGTLHLSADELSTLKAVVHLVTSMTTKLTVHWAGAAVVAAQLPATVTAIISPLKRLTKAWL